MATFNTIYAQNPYTGTNYTGRRREICGQWVEEGSVKFIMDDEFFVLRPDVHDKDRVFSEVELQFNSRYGNVTHINGGRLTIITSEDTQHTGSINTVPNPITDTATFQLDNPLYQSPGNQMNNWTYAFELDITLFGGEQVTVIWTDQRKSPFEDAEFVGKCCKSFEYVDDDLPETDEGDTVYPIARLAAAYDVDDNMNEVSSNPSSWNDDCGNPQAGNSDRKVKWMFYLNEDATPIHVLDFQTVDTTIIGLGTSVHGELRFNNEDDVVTYLETETSLDIVDGDIIGMEILILNCAGDMSIEVSNRIQFVHNCCLLALTMEDDECMVLESNLCILEEQAAV